MDVGTGDMKFTDENTSKTLAELAAGGAAGLWEDKGTYAQLIDPDDIELQGEDLLGVGAIKAEVSDGMEIFDYNGNHRGYLGMGTYAFKAGADIDMNTSYQLKNLHAGSDAADSVRFDQLMWELSGSYSRLVTARTIDMRGEGITKILELKGSLGVDISMSGSNAAHSAWIEFMNWDHTNENLEFKVPTGKLIKFTAV